MKKNIVIAALITALTAVSLFAAGAGTKCAGTTKAGAACNAYAMKGGTYCHSHNPAKVICGAKTKAGTPCKHAVKTAGQHCHQHQSK
jgi:hypothetical protein